MLTLGCVIGTDEDARRIRESALTRQIYYRGDFHAAPYEIVVPVVTRKERGYLDRAMPCREGWAPKEFEMRSEDVARYRDVYRFLPAYAELLL